MNEERYLVSEVYYLELEKEFENVKLLDIGGGGEGIIGNIYGKEAVAVDIRKEELEETNNDALKMVMDAKHMPFLKESFDVITLFYALMYMSKETQREVLREAKRVLKPSGKLIIWDTILPVYDGSERDIYISKLEIKYNGIVVETGYGIKMDENGQTAESIISMVEEVGLTLEKVVHDKEHFRIECL
ncbi:MAG: class I SAM-dependent methyltransferase [Clostridiales bacterium]|nr:class I SAM-dependent methyltransferase [Clostridiales bacterium]